MIRCTAEEAAAIRKAAKQERRTVSAFVVRAVMNRISVQKRVESALNSRREPKRDLSSSDGAAMIGQSSVDRLAGEGARGTSASR